MAKRFFDVFLSIVSAILLSPLLTTVSLILRFTGEGKVFFNQQRVGKNGSLFHITKFATMLKDSPRIGSLEHTLRNDPRVLPVGKVLRQTKLNELPQIWDIFIGKMSFVGPRPTTPLHYSLFSPEYINAVKDLKPGLTGVGSIIFRDEERILSRAVDHEACFKMEITPYKEELEIWYSHNQSFWVDISLIALTVYSIFKSENSHIYRIFPTIPFKDIDQFG